MKSLLLAALVLLMQIHPAEQPVMSRVGVAADQLHTKDSILDYNIQDLGIGWYYDYYSKDHPDRPVEYVQTLYRHSGARKDVLQNRVRLNPGSYWIISNEPDHVSQANTTPQVYAESYYNVYNWIKEIDPNAQLIAGNVSQSSVLRLRYLDMVLDHYRAKYGVDMPIDVWGVHAYIMPENCGWGIGYPVGVTDVSGGMPCSYGDKHADLKAFKQSVIRFRQWMYDRGYKDKPLWITEYGVLLNESHGYSTDRVAKYMIDTIDWSLSARSEIGLSSDENRLVQRIAWFSVNFDQLGGQLYSRESKTLNGLGVELHGYLRGLAATSTSTSTPTSTPTSTLTEHPTTISTLTPLATTIPSATATDAEEPTVETALPPSPVATATPMAGESETPTPTPTRPGVGTEATVTSSRTSTATSTAAASPTTSIDVRFKFFLPLLIT